MKQFLITVVGLLLLLSIVFGCGYLVSVYRQSANRSTELQKQLDGEAQKDAEEIKKIEENVNLSQEESNRIINTDSNKYSNNSNVLTNKYCEYMCRQGVKDSSCFEYFKNRANKECS